VFERQVFDGRLAGAAARAHMHVRLLEDLPAPATHFDFILVRSVLRFAINAVDLDENILCHLVLLP
jgi:hypothetical protein